MQHRDHLQTMVNEQTEIIRKESEANFLLHKITALTNQSENISEIFEYTLNEVCLFTGWTLGHAYLFDELYLFQNTSKTWSSNAIHYPDFVKTIDHELNFNSRIVIINTTLDTLESVWIQDVSERSDFIYKDHLLNAGFKSAIGFSLAAKNSLYGVLEFFSTSTQHENNKLSLLLENICAQIGRVIERQQQQKVLIEAHIKSEKAAQAKSEFLSNMSHELRTPMHAILNYASMSLQQLNKGEYSKLEKYLCNIQTAGNRLLGLLNNLLDLAKMDSGNMSFSFSEYDFIEAIEHTCIELDSLLKQKNLNLETTITSVNSRAVFDKQRMIQVLVNIFSNAIKFSPPHTAIRIFLSDASLLTREEALCCRVENLGDRIPENELEKIFDKFIQSSKTKTGAGGTGLGLSISQEIVNAHKGQIWAQNNTPSGVSFIFLLPKNYTHEKQVANNL